MTLGTRRVLFFFGAIAALVVLLAAYYASRLLSDVEVAGLRPVNNFDAREAKRKIGALQSALKNGQVGFVRLTETEINSYLAKQYDRIGPVPLGWETPKPPPAGRLSMGRCQVDLEDDEATVYTWIVYPFASTRLTLVWARTGKFKQTSGKWAFEPTSMNIGSVEIPASLHSRVESWLGRTDESLNSEIQLLSEIPAIELRTHELSKKSELRLYSYAESNTVAKTGP